MVQRKLAYLGPEGTFTHQAAIAASERLSPTFGGGAMTLCAEPDVASILRAVSTGESWGVIAWENNVEGYVVPNLDALIDARDIVGFARIGIDVTFDAFVREPVAASSDGVASVAGQRRARVFAHSHDGQSGGLSVAASSDSVASVAGQRRARVFAHSHGLAQCKRFIAELGLIPEAASSNAAACRDLESGDVALGPSICGELYGLRTLRRGVQDFDGARTEFLVLAPREDAASALSEARAGGVEEYETIVTFIPLHTGPGVLANLLDVLRDAGLNMTSFISRPIKGHDGTYSFIITLDAAPWQPQFQSVLTEVAEHGDWVKTLAVYPRRERPNPPVDDWMLPDGGVHLDAAKLPDDWQDDPQVRKELMW